MLAVRGPYGSEWPVDKAVGHDVVLVAGGIGLAPLRPALYRMLNERANYGKIVLLYGARTQEDMLYRPELEQWRAAFRPGHLRHRRPGHRRLVRQCRAWSPV